MCNGNLAPFVFAPLSVRFTAAGVPFSSIPPWRFAARFLAYNQHKRVFFISASL
jgi:hypothetical protein